MPKRKGETFRDFGRRILKLKELVDKQYLFRNRDNVDQHKSQDLELIALNTFLRHLRTCPALLIAVGNPPNLQEAVDIMERVEPDMDIAELEVDLAQANVSETTPCKVRNPRNPFEPAVVAICQRCSKPGHEAFFCPVAACIYCKSNLHKSAECKEIPSHLKINITCKECKSPGHTIDPCPQRSDGEAYCQFCQAAKIHTASQCELVKDYEINLGFEPKHEGMTMARWLSRNGSPGYSSPNNNNQNCYICGDRRHFARNCPQNRSGRGPFHRQGNFNRGRGGYGPAAYGPQGQNFPRPNSQNGQGDGNQGHYSGQNPQRGGRFPRGNYIPNNFGRGFNRGRFNSNRGQYGGPPNYYNPGPQPYWGYPPMNPNYFVPPSNFQNFPNAANALPTPNGTPSTSNQNCIQPPLITMVENPEN